MNSRSRSKQMNLTRFLIATVILAVLLVVVATTINAQTSGKTDIPEIDAAMRAAIIDSVTAKLNTIYVFPDVAEEMEIYVRKRLKEKKYDTLTDHSQFCEVLTDDLRDVCHDKHLWVSYADDERLRFAATDSLTDDQRREIQRRSAYDNYGFYKLERLTGNVGYLDLRSFRDASLAGATAISAMKFLSNSDALIIDLRQNGGGSPSMIQLISSYFFEESQHLNSFYVRQTDSIMQFWTQAYVDGKKMTDIPIYILTSGNTFSAAEEFTYNLKSMKRATIVGETTGGGAHPVERHAIANLHVVMSVPFGRAINPITGTNWEGTGIAPHIETPSELALEVAHIEALKAILKNTTEENLINGLTWTIANMEALQNPVVIDDAIMQKYAGVYGPRTIIYENGMLTYQREGRPKFPMVAMSEDTFVFKDIAYFRLKVEMDNDGNPTALIGLYDDGHTDRSPKGAGDDKQ